MIIRFPRGDVIASAGSARSPSAPCFFIFPPRAAFLGRLHSREDADYASLAYGSKIRHRPRARRPVSIHADPSLSFGRENRRSSAGRAE